MAGLWQVEAQRVGDQVGEPLGAEAGVGQQVPQPCARGQPGAVQVPATACP